MPQVVWWTVDEAGKLPLAQAADISGWVTDFTRQDGRIFLNRGPAEVTTIPIPQPQGR